MKKGHDVAIWPSGKVDIAAFNPPEELKQQIQHGINERYAFLNSDIPAIKVWHLNGAENRKNEKQFLYTFYECNQPTKVEQTLSDAQTQTFFSSSCAAGMFGGLFIPLGFDSDFHVTPEKHLEGVVHFGLMGKFEHRKHTSKIIKTWLKKYGNNPKYQLSCLIHNPFYKADQMRAQITAILGGEHYSNINFLPFLETNEEVNEFLNAVDIDLTGLSGAEGWNLPSFNATCLGKWSVVLNKTSHIDWATCENSILVPSSGEVSAYDEIFFKKGSMFNQGTFYDWDEDTVISAMELAEKKVGHINQDGLILGKEMTYSNTVDQILKYL